MGRASNAQHSFTGGEFSELLLGRQDLEKYATGLFTCVNGLPVAQGPWTRRPGTAFLHQTKFNNKKSKLIPFQYSMTQTYILEFGDLYIRFFSAHGILTNTSQSITSVTQANPGVVTKNAHGYANGTRVQLFNVTGMTGINNMEVVVTNATANTFELWTSDGGKVDTTNLGAFTAGSMASIFEIVTPYTQNDVDLIRTVQSADTLYLFHPNFPQKTLVRNSALSWTLSTLVFTDGPYDVLNTSVTTLTPGNATNPASVAITGAANNGSGLIRITAAAHGFNTSDHVNVEKVKGTTEANGYWVVTKIDANNFDLQGSAFVNAYVSGGDAYILTAITTADNAGINNGQGFLPTDVGRLIRIQEGTVWGYVRIAFYTSATGVWVDILSTLTNTNPKANFRMGIWSDTTGYPACGVFYEDRLWMGGVPLYPQRIDGSIASNYVNFAPSATSGAVSDSNAISFTMNSNDVNAVRWLSVNERGILVGTAGGEWWVRASSQGVALTPSNISAKPSTLRGSAQVAPVNVAKVTLFMQRNSRKLREMAYVINVDGFLTPDLSQLSEHITAPAVTQIVYQETPQPVVWGRRSDGILTGMTYDRDAGVVGWHQHPLGGQSDAAGLVNPLVESLAVVADPTGTRDEVYLIVNRWINGGTKRYVEYMTKIWEPGDAQNTAFQLDCGWTVVNGSPSTTVSGISHLEGQTLTVYADGAQLPDVIVTNGTVTISRASTIVTLGYAYNSDGQTLPIEGGSQDGSAQGKIKRIHRVAFWLMDTLGLKYGNSATSLTEIIVRQWGAQFGTATPLFTGVTSDRFESDYDKLGQIYWRADGPFPATVCAVMAQFEVNDDS